MRTIAAVVILSTLAYAKPPNPADYPLTVTVQSSETKIQQNVIPRFTPTKTNTDCQINGDQANCTSTTPANGPLIIDEHVTYVKMLLGDVTYTVSCYHCAGVLAPGAYRAKWDSGRRFLKVLWSDGAKDHTIMCRIQGMDSTQK